MKAKYGRFLLVALFLVTGLAVIWKNVLSKETLYIAIAGPMAKRNGEAMVQGAQLYLDKLNREGGINGKKVKLLKFDDNNQAVLAKNRALEIVNSKALAVLGHYTSSASIAAAPIYQKYGVPAISGTATANQLTVNNDWYFRVIFTNSDQAGLLANYASKILDLDVKEAYIFFDENTYGKTLAEAFTDTANKIRLKIKHRWSFNSKDQNSFKKSLNQMVDTLAEKNEYGVLFVATHSTEAVKIVTRLRRLERKLPIMGPGALASSNFMQTFKNDYPQEKNYPGYYTDGIYLTSPFFVDIADKHAQDFKHEFIHEKKYPEESLITAAMYYDAAMVAVHAIKNTLEAKTAATVKEKRAQVKDNLWQLRHLENAVEGVTGTLYFNKNGDAIKSIPMGVYQKGKPIVTWVQYQPVINLRRVDNLLQDVLDNNIIQVNDRFMRKAQVVYAGLDFNDIRDLDTANATYMADFYLWFRFKEEGKEDGTKATHLNPEFQSNPIIAYLDTVLPAKFKKSNEEEIDNISFGNIFDPADNNLKLYKYEKWQSSVEDGVTTHTYRIKTTFKTALDFHDYPLDKQILSLQFRHNHLTRDELIYVVDVLGMRSTNTEVTASSNFFSVSGWKVNKISSFQNSQKNDSTLGIPELFDTQQRVEYSQFNILIDIERHVLSFILKNMLPVIFIIALGYVVFFTTQFDLQISININMIIATSLFHLQLASSLSAIDYNVLIEYVFYTVYMMAVLGIIASIIIHRQDKKMEKLKETVDEMKEAKDAFDKAEEIKKAEENISRINDIINRMNWMGKIGYPLIIAIILVVISYGKW